MRTIVFSTLVLLLAMPLAGAAAQDDGNAGVDTYLERVPDASGDKAPGKPERDEVQGTGNSGSTGSGGTGGSTPPPVAPTEQVQPVQPSGAGATSSKPKDDKRKGRRGDKKSEDERSTFPIRPLADPPRDAEPAAAALDGGESGLGVGTWAALLILLASVLAAVAVRRNRARGVGDG